MSGYDERRGNRYDPRERSPNRGDPRDDRRGSHRSDRNGNYYDPVSNQRDEGRRSYAGSDSRDPHHSGLPSTPSLEKLVDLPNEVPIPPEGANPGFPMQVPQGKIGRPLIVTTNHFLIQSLPTKKIYQYDLRMRVPPSSQRRGTDKVTAMQQSKALLRAGPLFGSNFVFDGVSLGWSIHQLIPVGTERESKINLEGHTPERPNEIELYIRNSGSLRINDLVNWMKGNKELNVEDQLKWLNATFRQDPAERFICKPKGLAFFTRAPGLTMPLQSTGGVLEAVRGIHQAVSSKFGQLCVNVDTVTAAFYTGGLSLLQVMKAFAGLSSNQDINQLIGHSALRDVEDRVTGVFFIVKHLNQSGKPKKIKAQGLTSRGAKETFFQEEDRLTGSKTSTSVATYFVRKYHIQLKYPDLPLINSHDGMFPAELCWTAPGERYKEPLAGSEVSVQPAMIVLSADPSHTADFIKFATAPAGVRSQQIMANVQRLAWHQLTTPQLMGLSVSNKMLEVSARLIPPPTPMYASGAERSGPEAGSWNLRGKRFIKAKSFRAWGVLYFPGGRQQASDLDLQNFCKVLVSQLGGYGIRGPNGPPAFLLGNPQGDVQDIIKNLFAKTGNAFKAQPDMFFVLLHEGAPSTLYKAIKNVCETVFGVPTQIMLCEKALRAKGQPQYLGNIAMKVNCKLGGTNSFVKEPLFQLRRFMMLGGDTSHPSPAELRRIPPPPSYCALTGTYDRDCSAYSAIATAQQATVELIESLSSMLGELLERYKHQNNGAVPASIVYWRDGVADSQEAALLAGEVRAMKDRFKELDVQIRLTVINVVKRHHTRFFPKSDRGDRLGNVLPGTVIESGPGNAFVVSQVALQGTVRPTNYKILLDENKLSADEFHRLILAGCFSYGRATRSVSVHSAVYYADQVAERAKMHMRTENGETQLHDVKDNLKYTMYWQ